MNWNSGTGKQLAASTQMRNANWRRDEAALGASVVTTIDIAVRQSEAVVPRELQHLERL